MRAAVISAAFGGYDEPHEPVQQTTECEWVYVTDNPELEAPGWDVVLAPGYGMHPRREAKVPKCFPFLYAALGTDVTIWLDGSMAVCSPSFVGDMVALADTADVAQFVHPWRDCIYAEATESAPLPKYREEPVGAQAAAYLEAGHPQHWGLWATGVIVRRHSDPVVNMGRAWWHEIDHWSYQDQVSQPYVLRQADLRPASIPGGVYDNQWLQYRAHRDGT